VRRIPPSIACCLLDFSLRSHERNHQQPEIGQGYRIDWWDDVQGSFKDVRVLVTGHTGFKGAWLTEWLKRDGAVVSGLALAPEAGLSSLFETARVEDGIASHIGDIRDRRTVSDIMTVTKPEVVFHLAAQPLVRRSYRDPIETFGTNVMGTVHVLEAARHCPSVRAIVCVTTDKVYDNVEWVWGYRENDRLGGKDPYSASKACTELVASSYMQTMLPLAGEIRLATARGGNVIGGGDWSEDRLIPDIVRSIRAGQPIVLRNPSATRPWQHVLELVRGYVILGRKLLDGEPGVVGSWNFGPERENEISVEHLLREFQRHWGEKLSIDIQTSPLKEAHFLRLDISKARREIGWEPALSLDETLTMTADWYRRYEAGADAAALMAEQIAAYQDKVAT
jgi:CDP-glucose 4,6-dehydratase